MNRLWDAATPRPGGYREAPPSPLLRDEGVLLIDVREPAEFDGPAGHVPGAQLVPLAQVADASRAWDPEQTVALICRSGRRSARAAEILSGLGFRRVVNVAGGMIENNGRGLPSTASESGVQ